MVVAAVADVVRVVVVGGGAVVAIVGVDVGVTVVGLLLL